MTARKPLQRYLCLGIVPILSACASLGPVTAEENRTLLAKLDEPNFCVALSGGGLRSAAFSTGVLRELRQEGVLDQIDLASATSGGGWALLWLYSRLSDGKTLEDIYGAPNSESSDALSKLERQGFIDTFWTGWTAAWGPARAAGSAYYASISSKFGKPFSGTSIENINKNVVKHHVPVPIIIASTFMPCQAGNEKIELYGPSGPSLQNRLKELMPMAQHVVEITPQNWGSPALGYSNVFPFELRKMEHWAKIASAAIDAPGYQRCQGLRTLGLTFGEHVTSPQSMALESSKQKEIFLADGGFVDNLAARTLIQRGCKSILISDAEHDPSLLFEAYRRLNADLALTGQRLVVKPIDDWLRKRGANQRPEDPPFFQADNSKNSIVQEPVLDGCITKGTGCDSPDDVISKVSYLKLSVDPVALQEGRMNHHIAEFYKRSSTSEKCTSERGNDLECSFPHTPTFKTDYTADEFRAYRLLGEEMVRLNGFASKFQRGNR